jgi:hypothetical protein
MIAQFPIENHSDQGQFAELSLKTIGKSEKKGDYYAIRSNCVCTTSMCRFVQDGHAMIQAMPEVTKKWFLDTPLETKNFDKRVRNMLHNQLHSYRE